MWVISYPFSNDRCSSLESIVHAECVVSAYIHITCGNKMVAQVLCINKYPIRFVPSNLSDIPSSPDFLPENLTRGRVGIYTILQFRGHTTAWVN